MGRHLVKRSVTLSGHATSLALEPAFLEALDAIATERNQRFVDLVAMIDAARDPATPLASALRVHALRHASGAHRERAVSPADRRS